jgi:hypothetical protein
MIKLDDSMWEEIFNEKTENMKPRKKREILAKYTDLFLMTHEYLTDEYFDRYGKKDDDYFTF